MVCDYVGGGRGLGHSRGCGGGCSGNVCVVCIVGFGRAVHPLFRAAANTLVRAFRVERFTRISMQMLIRSSVLHSSSYQI